MQEGEVSLLDSDVFYSPFQRVHRDTTLLILRDLLLSSTSPKPSLRYLDLFCGNGVRSLRFLKEICGEYESESGGKAEVIGIDSKIECVNIAKETAKFNNLDQHANYLRHKLTPTGPLLHEQLPFLGRFHVIDVDPFGSSIPYVQQCVHLLHDDGLLLLTCTDARDLFVGKSKNVINCNNGDKKHPEHDIFQTYGVSRPDSELACHEFGLRSAITAACLAVRTAFQGLSGEVSVAVAIVACWSFPHGCRLMLRVRKTRSNGCCTPSILSSVLPTSLFSFPLSSQASGENTNSTGNNKEMAQSEKVCQFPLSYVYANNVKWIALVGLCVCDECKCPADNTAVTDTRNVSESALDVDQGGRRRGWRRVGPLWSAATIDCTLIRAVLKKLRLSSFSHMSNNKSAGAASEKNGTSLGTDGTDGSTFSFSCTTAAVLLLERLLEENVIFNTRDSRGGSDISNSSGSGGGCDDMGGSIQRRHVYEETGLRLAYSWGVYSVTNSLHTSNKASATCSDICNYVNKNSLSAIGSRRTVPIFEDHKFYKSTESMAFITEQINHLIAEKNCSRHYSSTYTATTVSAATATAQSSVTLTGKKRKTTLHLSSDSITFLGEEDEVEDEYINNDAVLYEKNKNDIDDNYRKDENSHVHHNEGSNSKTFNMPLPPRPLQMSAHLDDSSVQTALRDILQYFPEYHSMRAGTQHKHPMPVKLLQHFSHYIESNQRQRSHTSTANDNKAASCSHCLYILVLKDPATTNDTPDGDAGCSKESHFSFDSRDNCVDISFVSTLDDAFAFITNKQDAKKEYNHAKQMSQLKYIQINTSTLDSSSASTFSSQLNKDHDKASAIENLLKNAGSTEEGVTTVKLNRKMRRLLAGKTRNPSNATCISACLPEANKSQPQASCSATLPSTAAACEELSGSYSEHDVTGLEELHKIFEHYVILLEPTGSTMDSQTCSLPLKNHHDLIFVPQTMPGVATAEYFSTIHILPSPLHSPPQSPGARTVPLTEESHLLEILVRPNAGLLVSNLKSGNAQTSNRRKIQYVYMNISHIHFKHDTQDTEDDTKTHIQNLASPAPAASRNKTKTKNKNNSFICAKGSPTVITVSSCQFTEIQGHVQTGHTAGASTLSTKKRKNIKFGSSGAFMNLFAALAGSFMVLNEVVMSTPSLTCGVYSSGKSRLTLLNCHLSDISDGCGVRCEAGSGLSMLQCTVMHCGRSGVFANNALYVHLQECNFQRNSRCGVEIFACQGSVDSRRSVLPLYCGPPPFHHCSQGVSITHSKISSNCSSGVLLLNSSACLLAHCLIMDNHMANVSATHGTTCDVLDCTITSSGRSGIFARDRFTSISVVGSTITNNATHDTEAMLEAVITTDERN